MQGKDSMAFGISPFEPSGWSGSISKSQPATNHRCKIHCRYGFEEPRKPPFFPAIAKTSAKVLARGAFVKRITHWQSAKPFLNSMTSRLKIFKLSQIPKNFRRSSIESLGLAQSVVASLADWRKFGSTNRKLAGRIWIEPIHFLKPH